MCVRVCELCEVELRCDDPSQCCLAVAEVVEGQTCKSKVKVRANGVLECFSCESGRCLWRCITRREWSLVRLDTVVCLRTARPASV